MNSSQTLVETIILALREIVRNTTASLHAPEFRGNEWVYVKECLDSTYVSSVGKFVDQFEAELELYTGARHVVAVVNGTAALHMALLLAGVKPGDEVLLPALSFVATTNASCYCGAVPHFVDCDPHTLGIDVARLREYLRFQTELVGEQCVNRDTGRVIRALVPMHTFGHPGDIDGMLKLAADFKLKLVEDAAESLGSFYHGQHTGTFGLVGTLSFNGNKTITTGGGGALLFKDSDLARRAKHLTTTAKLPHAWEYRHDEIAFNYRLPNINAALGCAQLEELPAFILEKRNLYHRYRTAFESVEGVNLFAEPAGCKSNYWLQTLILNREYIGERDSILSATNAAGLMTRPAWTLMHKLEPFKNAPRMDLSNAELMEQSIINIPSSAVLGRTL
jgi:perosamine synthetase